MEKKPGERRKAPRPSGVLSGKRTGCRRSLSLALASINRWLDKIPLTHWLHRRIRSRLEMPDLTLPLRPDNESLSGLRIAFVSDVHAGSFLDEADLAEICGRVQAQEPDLVLFGGDMINTRDREILLFRRALTVLKPRYGMFAVPGNHDHFFGPDISLWRGFLEDNGVQVLMNRGVRIKHGGQSLWLCGVDDLTEGEPNLDAALEGRREGETSILISHHPDFFLEAADANIDLQLSGHTHGGQIRIGGKAPLHHSSLGYEQGWFTEGESRMYVGRGVGVTVLPIRIGAPPEVPMITLRSPVERTESKALVRDQKLTVDQVDSLIDAVQSKPESV
ncbi:MAG: putative MPP superfamily phosphohydrolase [Planctomycetota bacterium]|jgi:predicted MPP superfamily phosphohydrolase